MYILPLSTFLNWQVRPHIGNRAKADGVSNAMIWPLGYFRPLILDFTPRNYLFSSWASYLGKDKLFGEPGATHSPIICGYANIMARWGSKIFS